MRRYDTETNEQAEARWRAENPGKDLERSRLKVIIIHFADSESTDAEPVENSTR
jgi:hypothetical protein